MPLRPQTRGDGSAPPDRVPLPPRYQEVWDAPFRAAIESELRPGMAILDVGSGRNPTVPVEERPVDTTYVGLDLSADELDAAGAGAYDEHAVADVGALQDQLIGRFDLIVSWQVLEHVEDLGAAFVCMRAYLKPGGVLVAMFSGGRSAFAIVNRLVPFHIGAPIVKKIMGRSDRNPVFPAYYDRCTAGDLRTMLRGWSVVDVTPFYAGARYFGFSTLATRAYLAYEDRITQVGAEDWATHYLLAIRR
jgi:2-polyprenyl-6-hydroxyphenyl methylase/3-demethylubiquinone-9 3-methyltransferase